MRDNGAVVDVKTPNDMVNLKNITGEKDSKSHRVIEFHYDGEVISVDSFRQLPRYIADHGIRSTASLTKDGVAFALAIEELPPEQRTREGLSKAAEDLFKTRLQLKDTQEINIALRNENDLLKAKIEKMEKKLARS